MDDIDCLRGKYILVCRTSGVHRLPSYQRAASKGAWAPPHERTAADALPLISRWASLIEPVPGHPTRDGYGARLVFLHPSRVPWAEPVAHDWILADCADINIAWAAVSAYVDSKRKTDPTFTGFSGVVSFDEFSIAACAHIAEQLGLRHTTPLALVQRLRNKFEFRQLCEQIGIPVPRAVRFRISDVFHGALSDILRANVEQCDSDGIARASYGSAGTAAATTATFDSSAVGASPAGLTHTCASPSESAADAAAAVRVYLEHHLEELQRPDAAERFGPLAGPLARAAPSTWSTCAADGDTSVELTDEQWQQYYADVRVRLAAQPLQYPLVLKPVAGAGSNFVRRVRNCEELLEALALFTAQCAAVDEQGASAILQAQHVRCVSGRGESAGPVEAVRTEDAQLLQSKWRHWGLSSLDTGFMVEECMEGQEIDLDLLIQDGEVRLCVVNDNFPTAGHALYFMEAGGQVVSSLPFAAQLGVRVMAQRLLAHLGPTVSGVWHLEAMVATNMAWAADGRFGVMAGPGYACMPIEVNQRMGGSEVPCLTSAVSGVDMTVEHMKVACGVRVENLYSWQPEHNHFSHLAWERFPGAPGYDPLATIPPGPGVPSPAPAPTLASQPLTSSLSGSPDIHTALPTAPPLYTQLPAPASLMPRPEPISYAVALGLAQAYAKLYALPLPTRAGAPGSDHIHRFRYACSIDFVPTATGVLTRLALPQCVLQDSHFLGATMWYDAAQHPRIQVPPVAFDFLGWLAVGGDSPQDAQQHLFRLAALLDWEIDPDM